MLKFITKKTHHVSTERQKAQKELFAFARTASHGFPHNPTALAWDSSQQLFAIGTKTGNLRVYGGPGVEWTGCHEHETSVVNIQFIPCVGRLITLTDDNVLHLWEINLDSRSSCNSKLECVKSLSHEDMDRLKKVFVIMVHSTGSCALVGSECGDVGIISLKDGAFSISDTIYKHDELVEHVPEDFKIHPGSVECLAENPKNASQILVGFQRGVIALLDRDQGVVTRTFVAKKDLTYLSWQRSGDKFVSAHNDGSYKVWSVTIESKPLQQEDPVYGPYPCKSLEKLVIRSSKLHGQFTIFSGGMPRSLYADKNTVSVHARASPTSKLRKKVFDFTSRVVDFFVIDDSRCGDEYDNPHTLVVLLEQELVAIDLETDEWPQLETPYLASLHSSAITCVQHVSDVPFNVMSALTDASARTSASNVFSTRGWPVRGGKVHTDDEKESSKSSDLLITGHEDGSVRLWDATGVTLRHVITVSTSQFFAEQADVAMASRADDDDEDGGTSFLPFQKVGCFDPFSDDPRFAIKKLHFHRTTGLLTVGGTAGQILVFKLATRSNEVNDDDTKKAADTMDDESCIIKGADNVESLGPKIVTINLVGDLDGFTWKGCEPLTPVTNVQKANAAAVYTAHLLVQMSPPAGITALIVNPTWGMVAAGTAHGFGVADIDHHVVVMTRCTLNASGVAASGDPMSRRKSFKKSLRESFRRLRKGRSGRSTGRKAPEGADGGGKRSRRLTDHDEAAVEARPVERQVEARSNDDAMSSMVRTLRLTESFLVNSGFSSKTLWAGTNSGTVYAFTVHLASGETAASATLCKEIRLKHRAPVIAIHIVDAHGFPIEVEDDVPLSDNLSPHWRLILCSEEQLKAFTLPALKPVVKVKITANEGSRLRRATTATFRSINGQRVEHCMCTLTNQGEIAVWSMPELRRQLFVPDCIRHDDINGISSMVFTKYGEGFYLNSASEFDRFSVSASRVTTARCTIDLPDGARLITSQVPEPRREAVAEESDIIADEDEHREEQLATPDSPAVVNESAVDSSMEVTEVTPDSGVSSLVVSKEESESTQRSVSEDGNQVNEQHDTEKSVHISKTETSKKEEKTDDGAMVVTTVTTKKVVQQKKQKRSKKTSKVVSGEQKNGHETLNESSHEATA